MDTKEAATNTNTNTNYLLNKLLNKYKIESFSLPPRRIVSTPQQLKEATDILDRFWKLASQDRWSKSRIVWEAIKEYEQRHAIGNPQTRLDKALEKLRNGKPIINVKNCSFCATKASRFVHHIPSDKTYPVCEDHAKGADLEKDWERK